MRIGIDARFAVRQPRRGIGTYSVHLLKELVALDRTIEFVLYIDCEDYENILPEGTNVRVRRLWPIFYPLWEQFALPVAVLRDKVDLLHTLGNTAPLWLLSSTHLVLTLHDVMFLQSGEFIPIPTGSYQRAGRLYRRLVAPGNARRAATVITISEFSRQDILKLIANLSPVKVVPILEACDPHFNNRSTLQQNFTERPYLLCLGAEDPRKNTLRIVQAYLNAVENHNIEEDLVITGYSNCNDSPAHRLVKAAAAEARVHFLPFISLEELVALYQQATALLYISLYEGFGIPILEAYACGCPVIASNTTSIPEVGGDAAVYVNPTDVSAIESAIVRLCASTGLHSELRARGLERAKQFRWENTARETLAVYRKVLCQA